MIGLERGCFMKPQNVCPFKQGDFVEHLYDRGNAHLGTVMSSQRMLRGKGWYVFVKWHAIPADHYDNVNPYSIWDWQGDEESRGYKRVLCHVTK
jgi:hypothetical protein